MPRSAASPYGIEMIWLVLFDLFAIEGYLLLTRSGGLLFRRVGVNSDSDSSRRTGIYSADRIQGLNSVRVSCRTFHHITAHPKFFLAGSPQSSITGRVVSYVVRLTRVIVFTDFELEHRQPCLGAVAISSQSARFVRCK